MPDPPSIEVPFFDLRFGEAERQAVRRAIESGWLTMGPRTEEFEEAFARAVGADHVVAMSNCTAALHLSLEALGIGAGDEVICPSLTFVATANAVRYVGADVVFGDVVGPRDLTLDPADVESKLTERTRAVVAVHYAGYPADLRRLSDLCRDRGVHLVEDSAHACISTLEGRACGTWGACGCFSFYSNKNITCGEGGAVVTQDAELAARLRLLRSHGMQSVAERARAQSFDYDVVDLGYNYRLDEMRAGLLLAQLDQLPAFLHERAKRARRYRELLADLPIEIPDFGWEERSREGDRCGHHIFPVLLPADVDRDAVILRLRQLGVQTSVHYPPIHRFSSFSVLTDASLPKTEDVASRELTLPLFPHLSDAQQEKVRDSLELAIRGAGASPRASSDEPKDAGPGDAQAAARR